MSKDQADGHGKMGKCKMIHGRKQIELKDGKERKTLSRTQDKKMRDIIMSVFMPHSS